MATDFARRQLLRCSRNILIALPLGSALLAFAAPALAQNASQPLRLVVPFGAGTTTDVVSRVVAESLRKTLGQTVIVENHSGAGGNIGANQVAKAAPNGQTLLVGTVGTHAINVSLYAKLPHDPLRDFIPIGFVGYTPTMLVVPTASPAKTVKDLAALARMPGGISFASAGNGTSGHLAGELLKACFGGEMLRVPYKEGGQALTDVMAPTRSSSREEPQRSIVDC